MKCLDVFPIMVSGFTNLKKYMYLYFYCAIYIYIYLVRSLEYNFSHQTHYRIIMCIPMYSNYS